MPLIRGSFGILLVVGLVASIIACPPQQPQPQRPSPATRAMTAEDSVVAELDASTFRCLRTLWHYELTGTTPKLNAVINHLEREPCFYDGSHSDVITGICPDQDTLRFVIEPVGDIQHVARYGRMNGRGMLVARVRSLGSCERWRTDATTRWYLWHGDSVDRNDRLVVIRVHQGQISRRPSTQIRFDRGRYKHGDSPLPHARWSLPPGVEPGHDEPGTDDQFLGSSADVRHVAGAVAERTALSAVWYSCPEGCCSGNVEIQ